MRVVLVIIRLFLLATAVVAVVGAFTVGGSEAGRELLHSNQNMWSGLLGALFALLALLLQPAAALALHKENSRLPRPAARARIF